MININEANKVNKKKCIILLFSLFSIPFLLFYFYKFLHIAEQP